MRRQARSGLVTVCVLVCLLVATSLAMVAMRSALRERREIMVRHQMLQTEFLLDAGVRRGITSADEFNDRSGTDGEFETWQPRLDSLAFLMPTAQTRRIDDEHVEVIATIGIQPSDPARASASVTRRSRIVVLSKPNPPSPE